MANEGIKKHKGVETLNGRESGGTSPWYVAESGSGSGSQGPVNFHRPHLKMLVEDANTSKDIRDTISRPLHLLGKFSNFVLPIFSHREIGYICLVFILLTSVEEGLSQRGLKFLVNLVARIAMDNSCEQWTQPFLFLFLFHFHSLWQICETQNSPLSYSILLPSFPSQKLYIFMPCHLSSSLSSPSHASLSLSCELFIFT